ncbi:MAG: hypothetical protein KIT31_16250 [Deltaproteobacteria bacterium]|nr:hypothetical protein [Deltaproteobacteria bacterium]
MIAAEPAWRALFEEQLTCELMERVIASTERLTRSLARFSTWSDSQTAHDRLHTVIIKTLEGALRWDPGRIDLERYLVGAVRTQMTNEIQHAKAFRHVSIDDDEQDFERLDADISRTRAVCGGGATPFHESWSHVMDALRAFATADSGVRALIHAYEHGCFARGDVMAFTGLSKRQYYAAYQSLLRIAKSIDVNMTALLQEDVAQQGNRP